MKKNDIIFAVMCGLAISWIAADFFKNYFWISLIILPVLSVAGLWLAELIGKRISFVTQGGKFVLAGAFADVVDIKVFQFLFWLLPFSLLFKAISFTVATFIKYWCDKYWTFEKYEKEKMNMEILKFFIVAVIGALLNVVSFYYFGKINIGISSRLWTESSIILAAIAAGLWNFLGYKFIVFKK